MFLNLVNVFTNKKPKSKPCLKGDCKVQFVIIFLAKLMGNNCFKGAPVPKRKEDYPLKLQEWSTGWRITKEHRAVIEKVFSHYGVQDVKGIFYSLLGEYHDFQAYYQRIHKIIPCLNSNVQSKRIMLLGKDFYNKLDILTCFTRGFVDRTCDTIIDDMYYKHLILSDGIVCRIDILFVSMEEPFNLACTTFICESNGIIIVYDLSQLGNPEDELHKFFSYVRKLSDTTVLVAGTNAHLRNEDFAKYEENLDAILNFCTKHNLCYIEISPERNINVQFLFQFAVFNMWFDSL
ncbi:GTP-binding nuclear protein RAN1 [Reticulomyxa filosa]|uniref:GTP-binding nuclear protein RAN1 n=1 Tax=Reticulomyxa filosa TaxID=46433 RepID=X6MR22_RETFI|nr:GTP-binding nuclear protein RAN1 [Reticulomyxa filosa]|eukprot:ETO16428.1 GTP-binding nuclear protein RAN1 [Reticulomyxa filosa]